VLPEFQSPLGHMRSKAAWVAGQYADIGFQGGNFQGLLQCIVRGLRDPELPVRCATPSLPLLTHAVPSTRIPVSRTGMLAFRLLRRWLVGRVRSNRGAITQGNHAALLRRVFELRVGAHPPTRGAASSIVPLPRRSVCPR
jgi:hypothetical protein